ncbi:phosphodiesterase [Occultella glacieicola]|uniref:Phosphodiesterase n=1 Tax=Occultella glacieicola TaxID=2518684 RepID=A0ABY2E4T1_9MICO|nr:phosphodiesterase [Occultella glacieicola]TDE94129.1 phosphodiesterase [Occultella glacieicola]
MTSSSPLRAAEYPHADHVLVHLSDTHFLPDGQLLHGVAPVREHLEALLADLESTNLSPEALIFTGDLADRGEEEAYRNLRGIVEPLAQRLGAELIWVMGNHDDRATLRRTLLDTPAGSPGLMEPYDRVVMLGGLRLVVLDSTVPGRHHGEITPEQLDWLAGVLADPAPEGTILALHHPPAPCVMDLLVTFELRDQRALADVLTGTDVRAILAGHHHYSSSSTFAGIPVSVASATCYTQDLQTPDRGTRGRDGAQAFNLVHVYADTILHSVVPMGGGATVGEQADAARTAERLAAAGMYIPDAHVPSPAR